MYGIFTYIYHILPLATTKCIGTYTIHAILWDIYRYHRPMMDPYWEVREGDFFNISGVGGRQRHTGPLSEGVALKSLSDGQKRPAQTAKAMHWTTSWAPWEFLIGEETWSVVCSRHIFF